MYTSKQYIHGSLWPTGSCRRHPKPFRIANFVVLWVLGFGCGVSALAQDSTAGDPVVGSSEIAIEPMTRVVMTPRSGYFSDPYPIHLAKRSRPLAPQSFSGTTNALLACPGDTRQECFKATPVTVSVDPMKQEANAHRSTIIGRENNNISQDNFGKWHMVTTLFIRNPAYPNAGHWNVIVHAHPTDPSNPTNWVTDSLLVGSFAQPTKANYDGKYFEDAGHLYLVYSKRLSDQPAQDGIVAQLMQSPTQPAAAAPTVLLAPATANGGYNSEFFFYQNPKSQFKLIETGNVTKIDGKYAMAYSTGAYDEHNYKAGVAWSDTFLPTTGSSYKRVLKQDTAGVWGQRNHLEVRYLLQAHKSAWPNYVANQVLAPGVPSIVKDQSGVWYLYFAAYLPSDAPTRPPAGNFDPSHRRPYFVKLQVAIPDGATVATTSNKALASWITPVTR